MLTLLLLIILGILAGACTRPPAAQPATHSCDTLSIMVTGDVMLARGVAEMIGRTADPAWPWHDVDSLFHTAAAVVVNLECPVTDVVAPVNKQFNFRADPGLIMPMRRAGVTHAALANNHTIDQGRRGLADTRRRLIEDGIVPIGAGDSQAEALEPVIIGKGAVRAAVFNAVTLPLENWPYVDSLPDVCRASVADIAEAVRRVKAEGTATHVIVVLHWGAEHQLTPTLQQRIDAHRLVNAGVDAVIGHHPHVLQPAEVYRGRPIYYSLGNFVFDQHAPANLATVVLELRLTADTIAARVHPARIERCRPVPEIR